MEIGTYKSTGFQFLAGRDGLSEMLSEVAFPIMLFGGISFDAGKVLSIALDLVALMWAKLCYCVWSAFGCYAHLDYLTNFGVFM